GASAYSPVAFARFRRSEQLGSFRGLPPGVRADCWCPKASGQGLLAEIWTCVQVLLTCVWMPRTRASNAPRPTPELLLRKATLARTSGTRAKYAERGLAASAGLDRTTRALLLRQLYLSHMEARRFAEALAAAEQMIL